MAGLAQSGDLGLEELSQPLLLIHGDDDRLAPLAIAEWLHRHAPGSELIVVEGGSHMLPITHADLLADRIAAHSGGD
jgi:pimeloyl-ACP methyl ester carboxylesterase